MKLKKLSLLAATLALTFTATPLTVKAQQNSPAPKPTQEIRGKCLFQHLNLTPEQKAKMQEISRNTRAQIEAVLTPQQQAKLKAAMAEARVQEEQGQHRGRMKVKRDVFASLNLLQAQKDQIKQIKQSSREQMQTVLTSEQKAQIKKFRRRNMFKEMSFCHQQSKSQ
ncbi:MAG: P pilus assembly/Cpx signaling pathway, periplasmic inhibitor/zinc-resistance associated protein [Cuspidothrix sp.]